MTTIIADIPLLFLDCFIKWIWLYFPYRKQYGISKRNFLVFTLAASAWTELSFVVSILLRKYVDVLGLRLWGTLPSAYALNLAADTVLYRGLIIFGYYCFFQLQQRNRYTALYSAAWHMMCLSSANILYVALEVIYRGLIGKDLPYTDLFIRLLPFACSILCIFVYIQLNKKVTTYAFETSKYIFVLLFSLDLYSSRLEFAYEWSGNTEFAILSILIPFLWVHFVNGLSAVSQYRRKESEILRIKTVLENELGAIHGYTEQISETRHTLLHHMNNLQKFIEKEDTKGAEIYIHSIMNEYSREEINYCENVYVNAVLNYYADRYPEVSLDVKATIGSDCMIRPMDIGLLVFVIMEEAVTEGNKAINLRIAQIEDTVVITFKNIDIKLSDTDQLMIKHLLSRYTEKHEYNNRIMRFVLQFFPE